MTYIDLVITINKKNTELWNNNHWYWTNRCSGNVITILKHFSKSINDETHFWQSRHIITRTPFSGVRLQNIIVTACNY